mgnify:CR=1 FL=1
MRSKLLTLAIVNVHNRQAGPTGEGLPQGEAPMELHLRRGFRPLFLLVAAVLLGIGALGTLVSVIIYPLAPIMWTEAGFIVLSQQCGSFALVHWDTGHHAPEILQRPPDADPAVPDRGVRTCWVDTICEARRGSPSSS